MTPAFELFGNTHTHSTIALFALPTHTLPKTSNAYIEINPQTGDVRYQMTNAVIRESCKREIHDTSFRKAVYNNMTVWNDCVNLGTVKYVFRAAIDDWCKDNPATSNVRLMYGGDVDYKGLHACISIASYMPDLRFTLTTHNIEAANNLFLHQCADNSIVIPDNLGILLCTDTSPIDYIGDLQTFSYGFSGKGVCDNQLCYDTMKGMPIVRADEPESDVTIPWWKRKLS